MRCRASGCVADRKSADLSGAAAVGVSEKVLAERLAAYADGLRYDDLDAETIERVKSHVIDTLGCGIAAFDERPVRICRDVVLAAASGASTVIGTKRAHRARPGGLRQRRRVPLSTI